MKHHISHRFDSEEVKVARITARQAIIVAIITAVVSLTGIIISKALESDTKSTNGSAREVDQINSEALEAIAQDQTRNVHGNSIQIGSARDIEIDQD